MGQGIPKTRENSESYFRKFDKYSERGKLLLQERKVWTATQYQSFNVAVNAVHFFSQMERRRILGKRGVLLQNNVENTPGETCEQRGIFKGYLNKNGKYT